MLVYLAIIFVPALAALCLQLLCYASYKKSLQTSPQLHQNPLLQNA